MFPEHTKHTRSGAASMGVSLPTALARRQPRGGSRPVRVSTAASPAGRPPRGRRVRRAGAATGHGGAMGPGSTEEVVARCARVAEEADALAARVRGLPPPSWTGPAAEELVGRGPAGRPAAGRRRRRGAPGRGGGQARGRRVSAPGPGPGVPGSGEGGPAGGLRVAGGAGGVTARLEDLDALTRALADAAADAATLAARALDAVGDPALLAAVRSTPSGWRGWWERRGRGQAPCAAGRASWRGSRRRWRGRSPPTARGRTRWRRWPGACPWSWGRCCGGGPWPRRLSRRPVRRSPRQPSVSCCRSRCGSW
jgi:hypothetical protein